MTRDGGPQALTSWEQLGMWTLSSSTTSSRSKNRSIPATTGSATEIMSPSLLTLVRNRQTPRTTTVSSRCACAPRLMHINQNVEVILFIIHA